MTAYIAHDFWQTIHHTRETDYLNRMSDNVSSISNALEAFRKKYGSFPNPSTAPKVHQTDTPGLSLTGDASNDFFSQLLADGAAPNELIFHAVTKGMAPKVDNVYNDDATALAHGECAFAYILVSPPHDRPRRPVAFGPVIPGTRQIDTTADKGLVHVLYTDGSFARLRVNTSGEILQDGTDLLDHSHPIWAGHPLDIKWPK